jgi:DNA-binding response OmpR family regulator
MSTILAIDDDKTTLNILESQMSGLGYRVFTERAAVKGIEIARSFSPDVILLDLHMPVMDGFKVLSALKKDKTTKDIPVIMLTSNKEKETVMEAMRHGVIDYIVKPYNPDKLNLKIRAAIDYSTHKKNYEDYIVLNRKRDITVAVMRGSLGEKGFQDDARTVFNSFLMKQMTGKICIFDMRAVSEMSDDDLLKLGEMVKLFYQSTLKIVAGRHYGAIVSKTEIEKDAELFLSFGDLELALNTDEL